MDAKLFIFFTFVTYLWFGEAETYCTNANSTEDVYGELGENATLSCTIPRDCVGGIWLHTDTSKWMFQGTQAQNHGYLVSTVYHNNRFNNFLHIYNISIDRTGFYSCICQTRKSADVNVEQACINFKIGSPCQMNFSRNDVQNILTSGQRSEVHVHDTITTRCAEGLKWKSNCPKDDIDSRSFVVTNVHNNCVITCKRTNKDDQQCKIKVVLKVVEESLDQTSLRNDIILSDYTTMAPQETSIVTDILTVTERLYTSLTTKYKVNTIRSSTDRISDTVSSIFTTQENLQSSIILTTSSKDKDVTKLSTEDASSMTRYTISESSTSPPTTTALVTTTLTGPDESKVYSAKVFGIITTASTSLHSSSVRTEASGGSVTTSGTFPEYLSASTQVKNDVHSTTTSAAAKFQSEITLSNDYISSQFTSTKIINTWPSTYAYLVAIIITTQTLLLIIMCFVVSAKRRKRNINDGASIAMENVTSGDEPNSQISTLPRDIPISTSPTLPELPTIDSISQNSNDSEDYYAASDRPIEQTGIFTEKDVCLILNIKKAKWYSRWMGTIPDSKGDKKYVMLTTVSEKVIRSKQIHWNEFIKRNIDLPTTKHLVDVEGIAVLQGRFHLVQELHVTESLESRLAMVSIRGETQIPMHLSEVIQLMDGILEGMNVIHSYGFLHPGLSTKKIILAGEGHIKLYDFCLAKDARNVNIFNKSKLSRSLNNFAPEAMYRNEYSSPADVWSTAVVIWELLTGKPPFPTGQDGKDFDDLLAITPVETQVTKYEQLKNKLLFQCWHLPCPLRPTIPELRESYTKIFDRFKDDSYEIPRSDLYTSMSKTNSQSDDEDYTDNYTVAS